MVVFCPECFFFGYSKYYQEFFHYNGFEEKINDYGDLVNYFCPECQNEEMIEADLPEYVYNLLKEISENVDGLTLSELEDDPTTAKELSLIVLLLSAIGECSIGIKRLVSSQLTYEPLPNDGRGMTVELLKKAMEAQPKVLVNAVKILSERLDEDKRNKVERVCREVVGNPEVLANLV